MEFILSVVAMLVAVIAMLAINHVIYKREKTLLEINGMYKKYYLWMLDTWRDVKNQLIDANLKKEAYRKAINDCIENFNATYSNTKLSFDEAKCAFVIEDIDVDDNLPTEEEITPQNENKDENQQSI